MADKSLAFAVRIGKLNQYLTYTKHEFVMAKQIIRSGTSIGANICEANFAQSKSDFLSKLHIALKETAETEYWIKLLFQSALIDEKLSSSLLDDCLDIKHLLIASLGTAKGTK